MLASKTSHKRRRSSARGDISRANDAVPRAIITAAGVKKGKQKEQPEESSWVWKRFEKVIASHPINHSIQIIAPVEDISSAEQLVDRLPKASLAYFVKAPISLFLDPIFITSHVKRGSLVAISRGNLDTDDVFCLDGRGVLHLSLTRDTYQTLGLVGQMLKQSRTSSGKGRDRLSGKADRWMVRIDLLAPSFVAGKPGFDKTLERFGEWNVRRGSKRSSMWEILFTWTDSEAQLGCKMHFPASCVQAKDVHELEMKPKSSLIEDCWVPLYSQNWKDISQKRASSGCDEDWTKRLEDYLEWASMTSMSSDCVKTYSRSDHLSAYKVGNDCERGASLVVKIEYRGLLPSELCFDVVCHVRNWLFSRTSLKEQICSPVIACSGFSDSPLAWRMDALPDDVHNASSQGAEDDEENTDFSEDTLDVFETMIAMTGRKARKKRQKKRSQRGHISRHQVGEQVKRPGTSGYNGWQVVLFDDIAEDCPEYICVENIGGCLRC